MLDVSIKLFSLRTLTLIRNRLFPNRLAQDAEWAAPLRTGQMAGATGIVSVDPLLEIRWEKVLAIRAAIAGGSYNLEARLEDLLDDPPAELLTALACS